MPKEQYIIEAGAIERPETVERGEIEKNTGQTVLRGETIKFPLKRADIGIPNYTECWGVRLDKEGKVPETPIDVKSPNYTGQIKEMKWGTTGGYVIICRYLEGYNSIDKQYQDVVLNASANLNEDTEAAANAYFIRLQSGDNVYDPETDKYLCQMIRVHYLNGSSVYRNPKSDSQMYIEVNGDVVETKEDKFYNNKFEAGKIVNEAASDNTMSKLKTLLNVVHEMDTTGIEVKDEGLYRHLSMLADTKPDLFLAKITEYKKNVSNVFEKAKSYNAIDLTKDGVIAAGKDKVELIGTDIPAKKGKMIDWVLLNYLEPRAQEIISKLTTITNKLN